MNLMNIISVIYFIYYQRKTKQFYLLKYDQISPTNAFLDDSLFSICSGSVLSNQKEKRNNSKTLIGSIYSNVLIPNNISGKLTATTSDHVLQCLIAPNIFSNQPSTKSNIFKSDWSKFDRKNFILYYLPIDWEDLIKVII